MQVLDTDYKMLVAIFGSRKIDADFAYSTLIEKMIPENEYITSGNIEGAAKVGIQVAREKGLKITCYNYKALGYFKALQDIDAKKKKMVTACDCAIVLWDGESTGTKKEIKMLNKQNKPYELFLHNANKLIDPNELNLT